jgi:hypothetical protein
MHQAAPVGRVLELGLFTLKIRGFLARPAAEATQNVFVKILANHFIFI